MHFNFSISNRILALLLTLAVPVGLIGIAYDSVLRAEIDRSRDQLSEAAVFGPLLTLLNETSDHAAALLLARGHGETAAADAAPSQIDAALEDLSKQPSAYRSDVERLASLWHAALGAPGTARVADVEALTTAIADLADRIAQSSGLILDPDQDSFWLLQMAAAVLPDGLATISSIKRRVLRSLIANQGTIPQAERIALYADAEALAMSTHRAKDAAKIAMAQDAAFHGASPTLAPALSNALADYDHQHAALARAIHRLMAGEAMQPEAFLAAADGMHDGAAELAEVSLREARALIAIRIADLSHERLIALAKAAAAILAALIIYHLIARSIVRPLRATISAIERITKGDTEFEIVRSSRADELAQLTNAAAALKVAVAEAYRLKQILDSMPLSLMTIDVANDLRIDYINKASLENLRPIAKNLPIGLDRIIGSSVDIFHKDPSHQRRLLADPANLPHRARVQIGSEWMDLLVSPIRSAKGDYIGAMLCWSLVTSKVQMASAFETRIGSIVEALAKSASALADSANTMKAASQRTETASASVSSAATEADANVHTVASAAQELAASASEIASQIESVARKASTAASDAEATRTLIAELGQLAGAIGAVIATIKDIADQTNLLALNATIEAARAGEAGKGFAVVADEVKKLANETAQRTEQIDQQVARVQTAISRTVAAMEAIIGSVRDIDSATASVATAVEEQNAATAEIGRNVAEATLGTTQVTEAMHGVRNTAVETGITASAVLNSAIQLTEQAEALSGAVTSFLADLRKA